jgi:phosphonoacetaldehyde hydrolase
MNTNTPLRIRGIMLDWAGTTVDHGSIAPVIALQTLFANHRITLSTEDARRDMGLLKRDHIQAILALPNVREDWRQRYGKEPAVEDLDALFADFGPLQMQIITTHSQVIAGVPETVARWQQRGIRIGSSTGYTRAMLEPVAQQAATQGYTPDASVCPDEVGAGRPAPWMLARNAQLLGIYPPSLCVKIGDTPSDIEEGRNAGMWTIGLTRTGNMVGLDEAAFTALPPEQKAILLAQAETALRSTGAHFIAEDLPSCEAILREIERLLERHDGMGPLPL